MLLSYLMQKQRRLLKSKDFKNVRTYGRSWTDRNVVLVAKRRDHEFAPSCSRFGFVVSKRIGNSVVRNRFKRCLKESARQMIVKDGWDIVFIARNNKSLGFCEIHDSVRNLLVKSGLMQRINV